MQLQLGNLIITLITLERERQAFAERVVNPGQFDDLVFIVWGQNRVDGVDLDRKHAELAVEADSKVDRFDILVKINHQKLFGTGYQSTSRNPVN